MLNKKLVKQYLEFDGACQLGNIVNLAESEDFEVQDEYMDALTDYVAIHFSDYCVGYHPDYPGEVVIAKPDWFDVELDL